MANLKFYWNGLKEDGGKLQPYYLSMGGFSADSGIPADSLRVSAREYSHFSKGVWEAFDVSNDSDSMTDYFDKDRFTVRPDHPLYPEILEAYKKCRAHNHARQVKWAAKFKQSIPPPYNFELERANIIAEAAERFAYEREMKAQREAAKAQPILAPEYVANDCPRCSLPLAGCICRHFQDLPQAVMSEDALLRLQSASKYAM